ncbi:MAG: GNAT family N-acetyltransferase [Rhodobacteraceae bacterium]|nr:GNAT family N-acetyltransferase [Paracoccaceae bacterium]
MAKAAVRDFCAIAKNIHGVSEVTAQVARNNPASQHVLRRNGFSLMQGKVQSVELNGEPLWLDSFQKHL